jgi:DNA-binding SARP family transcriptional activator
MAGQELCGSPELAVKVNMLGPFGISLGGRVAGPWPRPSARRLCELVLLSPGQRVSRELAAEELFGSLGPDRAATALRKALSMARGVLWQLGEPAAGLLQADRDNIWFRSEAIEIDLDHQEHALRAALATGPGQHRDDRLVAALSDERPVLADAPYVEWALRCRDRFEVQRQRARLTLARDRSKGAGLSSTAAVLEAWESCLSHDPACEEAAAALMRLYTAQGARPEAVRTYERCRAALAELHGPSRAHKWLYIWPLVAVRLQEGKVAEAVTAARELLEASQKRLPDELHSIVESACLSWDQGEAGVAGGSLALALEMAYELRFF